MSSMDDFLLELPKAELHLHLEGSVEPETLHELDPSTSLEEYRALYQYTDFDAFPARLRRGRQAPAHARGLRADHAPAAGDASRRRTCGTPRSSSRPAWCCGRSRSSRRSSTRSARRPRTRPCEVRWILDAVRQFGAEHAMQVARTRRGARGPRRGGVRHRRQRGARSGGVVQRTSSRSRESAGLQLTRTPARAWGRESIWDALELGAERIGHGIARDARTPR